MYYANRYASVTPRRQQLCGFQRISLRPGETKTVSFEVTPEQLRVYDETLRPVEEARPMTIEIGALRKTIHIVSDKE